MKLLLPTVLLEITGNIREHLHGNENSRYRMNKNDSRSHEKNILKMKFLIV